MRVKVWENETRFDAELTAETLGDVVWLIRVAKNHTNKISVDTIVRRDGNVQLWLSAGKRRHSDGQIARAWALPKKEHNGKAKNHRAE